MLHKSRETITRWARKGDIAVADRIAYGNGGLYMFDPQVIAEKAIELAIGKPKKGDQTLLDVTGGTDDDD